MDEYRLEIWKRDFEEPLTVVLAGAPGKADAEARFRGLCETVEQGRKDGDPLIFISWKDVANLEGFTVEPGNTVKISLKGPDIDLVKDDF